MDGAALHALYRAIDDGDLAAIRQFFVRLKATRASSQQRRFEWHSSAKTLRWSLFFTTIRRNHLNVLGWVLSPVGCEEIDDTAYNMVTQIARTAIKMKRQDNTDVLELILQSTLLMEVLTPTERQSALQFILNDACLHGHVNLIQLAVAHGAAVNGRFDECPSLQHCVSGKNIECVEKLVECGVFGVRVSAFVRSESYEMTVALVKNEVDLRGEPHRWSPLHEAVYGDKYDVVKALLTVGNVDVNASDEYGITPLMIAVRWPFRSESSHSLVLILVKHGANPGQQCHSGETALHFAVRGDEVGEMNREGAAFLAKQDPGIINIPDNNGTTPLLALTRKYTASAHAYNAEDLDVLMSYGADPHIRDNQGESAHDWFLEDENGRLYMQSRRCFFSSETDAEVRSRHKDLGHLVTWTKLHASKQQ
ncbi:hypothetical protein Poli38472_012304 [Pythium oligandrum]|uniref:Ankyrin repeat protein n=1 Tax=Pythium oligandrum TaxID=41045 RepID=A0A8K1CQL8_PYTOL|nr:hypothetical protein Poli38472_012304 [Pythium oligandrum]|eukprot:TMW67188.1 hypothetical protein Poli38472_012304 [Pythium oligandrum]